MTTTENVTAEQGGEPTGTYKIADGYLADLTARFEKLARRAARIGVPAPTFTVVSTTDEPEMVPDLSFEIDGALVPSGRVLRFHHVTVDGQAPTFDGWHPVAVIDRDIDEAPNGPHVVNALNGYTIDQAWRTAGDYCDYCAEHGRTHGNGRKTLVVVEHEDDTRKIVGTTCLKDFLGGTAPTSIAAWVEILSTLDDLLRSFGHGEAHGENRYYPADYLAWVAKSIRTRGWVSRTRARDYGDYATADAAEAELNDARFASRERRGEIAPPEAQDSALAEAALEWGQAIEVDYDTNDYILNLSSVANKSGWRRRDLGLGASLITAYQREQEREIAAKARNADLSGSVHVGTVGERIDLSGKVIFTRSIESYYGVTLLIKILTDDGNVLTWFASNGGPDVKVGEFEYRSVEQGDHLVGKATVKKHDEYQGVNQTVVTRAKVTVSHE